LRYCRIDCGVVIGTGTDIIFGQLGGD